MSESYRSVYTRMVTEKSRWSANRATTSGIHMRVDAGDTTVLWSFLRCYGRRMKACLHNAMGYSAGHTTGADFLFIAGF